MRNIFRIIIIFQIWNIFYYNICWCSTIEAIVFIRRKNMAKTVSKEPVTRVTGDKEEKLMLMDF